MLLHVIEPPGPVHPARHSALGERRGEEMGDAVALGAASSVGPVGDGRLELAE